MFDTALVMITLAEWHTCMINFADQPFLHDDVSCVALRFGFGAWSSPSARGDYVAEFAADPSPNKKTQTQHMFEPSPSHAKVKVAVELATCATSKSRQVEPRYGEISALTFDR